MLTHFVKSFINAGLWYIAPMRLLFIADGRSPTTLSWLGHWTGSGHETHLISTFPCDRPPGLSSFHVLPVAFAGMAAQQTRGTAPKHSHGLVKRFRTTLRPLRYVLGPLSLPLHRRRFRALVDEIHPELVHSLRIPFEGMLATVTPGSIPLVVSTWGNDLTLHAHGSPLMKILTRRTLSRCDGLITDADRDIRLGFSMGFSSDKPTLVVPGAGGIHVDEIEAVSSIQPFPEDLPNGPIVVNARGQRPGSLRQDIFFQSIPLVLEKVPQALFVCPLLIGDPESVYWVETLGIGAHTKLWPPLNQAQLWGLYKRSLLYVSPSLHDGIPNSLLEAMASGCFPVVGNIESMQEWIIPGENGLLVDATSPRSLADGIITALESPDLRLKAKLKNAQIIAERADYNRCMTMVEAFYRKIADLFDPAENHPV
ncbi:MAG TPA: glycosyltransferase family 4 protein [Anaerolineales bacterium]